MMIYILRIIEYEYRKYIKKKTMSHKKQSRKNVNINDIIIKLKQYPYNDKSFALKEPEIEALCIMSRNIITTQPMLLELDAPIQVCGDTHGQFSDLLNIFRIYDQPDKQNYLFLGDYVDRGKQSLECICLLMAYKIKYPENFFFLRGNHESSELNKLYGFYDQCKRRTSIKIWKMISNTFSFYPLAAVISNRIFCVHGGLSPHLKNLSSLNSIKRPIDPLGNNIVSDILWSDPKASIDGWSDNEERGISYYYGKNVIDLFLSRNDFDLICRSHQVVEEGYQFIYERKLITIFSAPNYCGEFDNLGAILKIGQDLVCKLEQFEGKLDQKKKRRGRSVTPIVIKKKTEQMRQENKESHRQQSLDNPRQDRGREKRAEQSLEAKRRKPTKFIRNKCIEKSQNQQYDDKSEAHNNEENNNAMCD